MGTTTVVLAPEDLALVYEVRTSLGRKLNGADIANGGETGRELYEIAELWLPSQTDATLPWLRDLAKAYTRGGGLTDGQAAGVINCLFFSIHQAPAKPAPKPQRDSIQGGLVMSQLMTPGGWTVDVDITDEIEETYAIKVGPLVVIVSRNDEGVGVSVYPDQIGAEDTITDAWALYSEAEPDEPDFDPYVETAFREA